MNIEKNYPKYGYDWMYVTYNEYGGNFLKNTFRFVERDVG